MHPQEDHIPLGMVCYEAGNGQDGGRVASVRLLPRRSEHGQLHLAGLWYRLRPLRVSHDEASASSSPPDPMREGHAKARAGCNT